MLLIKPQKLCPSQGSTASLLIHWIDDDKSVLSVNNVGCFHLQVAQSNCVADRLNRAGVTFRELRLQAYFLRRPCIALHRRQLAAKAQRTDFLAYRAELFCTVFSKRLVLSSRTDAILLSSASPE
jgi:hypothetical protein